MPVKIPPALWAAALLVGATQHLEARGSRGRGQHRGGQQLEVNVIGAAAELLVHAWARATGRFAPDLAALADSWGERGYRGPDLPVSGLDVKAVPLHPRKRYWCINARVHDRRTATGYLGVGLGLWSTLGVVSSVVPHEAVSGWPCFTLGSQPSFNQRRDLLGDHGMHPDHQARAAEAPGCIDSVLMHLEHATMTLVNTYRPMTEERLAPARSMIEAHANGVFWAEARSLGLYSASKIGGLAIP